MELKDVILSTLAEMEENVPSQIQEEEKLEKKASHVPAQEEEVKTDSESSGSELIYLNSIRERLLVLFEGFQSPNNTDIEAKVDMTLNFLEYVLATIDERLESLEKGKLK